MVSTHTLDTGELIISYAEGPDTGPPLLMLHGLLGRWQDFEPLIPSLTDHWHVFACDLRGHGASDRAPDGSGYLVSDHVRDLSVFIRENVPFGEPLVLVGFSGGGLVALPLAAAFPERVRGIVALEPGFMMRNSSLTAHPLSQEIAWAHHAMLTAKSLEEMAAMCRDLMPEADEWAIASTAERLYNADPRLSDLGQIDRVLEGIDLNALATKVQCPMLIVRGDQSLGSVVRDEDVTWARANNPRVRAVQVPGGGHGVHLEQPEVVIRHMLAFLDEL